MGDAQAVTFGFLFFARSQDLISANAFHRVLFCFLRCGTHKVDALLCRPRHTKASTFSSF